MKHNTEDLLNFTVKRMIPILVDKNSNIMISRKREIEVNFDSWLKTMNPNDPENILILKRLSFFNSKISEWRSFGLNQSDANKKALVKMLKLNENIDN